MHMDNVEVAFYDGRASSVEGGFESTDSNSIETNAEVGDDLR
jgi:hypothetical protein